MDEIGQKLPRGSRLVATATARAVQLGRALGGRTAAHSHRASFVKPQGSLRRR